MYFSRVWQVGFAAFMFLVLGLIFGADMASAQTQTYRSNGGLSGQFQQLSPRTPAFDITARGAFAYDPNNFGGSQFEFTLAGAGNHGALGDIIKIRSTRFLGNRNGELAFEVAFQGVNGARTALGPVEARLVLVEPRTIPAGQAPTSMTLRLHAATRTVQFDLPVRLTR